MSSCNYCGRKTDDLFKVKFDDHNTNTYCKEHIRQVLEDSKKMHWHKEDKIYRVSERYFEFRKE